MRKKTLLLLTLSCCLAMTINAQIPAGTWLIGGDFYYGRNTLSEITQAQKPTIGGTSGTSSQPTGTVTTNINRITRFSSTPISQYAFADNWLFGLSVGYTHHRFEAQKDFVEITRTRTLRAATTYAIPIFFRAFFMNEIGFSGGSEDVHTGTKTTSHANIAELTYRPGFAYFFQDKIGVVINIGTAGVHRITKTSSGKIITTSDGFVSMNANTATIGLRFLLLGKIDEEEAFRREQQRVSGSRYY
jgi:hypothetical protein